MTTQPPDISTQPVSPAPRVLCPYCGLVQGGTDRCNGCRGLFEPLSRQATQNAMGAWQIRDDRRPFQPGCSWETLRGMVARGRIRPDTVLRGPTTRQFWTFARDTPGIAVLLGICHACHTSVKTDESNCSACGVELQPRHDRQFLGLSPLQLLPGDAPPERVATVAARGASGLTRPASPLDVGTPATPTPELTSEDERPSTVKRLRRHLVRARRSLILSVIFNLLLAAAVIGLGLLLIQNSRPSKPDPVIPATTPDATPAPSEAAATDTSPAPTEQAAPDESRPPRNTLIPGLDPGLERFAPQFLRAMELREQGTETALLEAVGILEGIQKEAAGAGQGFEGLTYPELEQTLADTRRELDQVVLREIF